MENNKLESIWVPGVPENINEQDRLQGIEIFQLCIKYVCEHFGKKEGNKIIGINTEPNAFPHVSIEKEGKKYALVILPNVYPQYNKLLDDFRFKFVEKCKEQDFIPTFCPILIHSYDKDRAAAGLMLKGDLFHITNMGQKILTSDPNQSLLPKDMDFKL